MNAIVPKVLTVQSTKTYAHNVGLSACFRQWRATHSHCQYLHGYALQVQIIFECTDLDNRNWCVDFGSLKPIKAWLEHQFDHKTLVAEDDPLMVQFRQADAMGMLQLNVVKAVGCEAFAAMIWEYVQQHVENEYGERVLVRSVEVREHEGNSAKVVYNGE